MRAFAFLTVLAVAALGQVTLQAAESSDAPATIRVTLPADATLTVNGLATQSTSSIRWFTTPPLKAGNKTYQYFFKAKFIRNGKTITVEQKVPVRAGRQSVVALDDLGTSSARVTTSPTSGIYQRNFYYDPQAPSSQPAAATNYYYQPRYYFGPAIPYYQHRSEWEPGNYKFYNP